MESNSEISCIVENNVRVQLLSDTIVRVETKGPKGFEDRPTYLVPDRTAWDNVEFTRETVGSSINVTTENYVIKIPVGAVNGDDVIIEDKQGKLLWRTAGNTTANVYLPSPSDELKSWYFTDNRVVPSENGYNKYDSESETPLNGWDFANKATDNYVFLPQGSYKQFMQDYIKVTGKSEMINKQMLGYWDSRWFAYSAETALQQIQDYRDKGYSIDILVIDTDWRKPGGSGGIGYDINKELFPDMAKFLADCHELGINIVFNDHPEPVSGAKNGLDKNEVAYRNDNIKLLLSLGLDTWWYDRNWHTELKTADESMSVFSFGMYAYQWMTQEYYESITDIGEYAKRGLIMGNIDGVLHGDWKYASDLSAHRYSIQWTGDIGSDAKALEQEVYASVFGGAEVGLPYLSSDIGGHTKAVTDEMYIRWMQYGALSTIFRVHCTDVKAIGQDGRMPWLFGETAEEVSHKYQEMRYRLMPLYYNLANENYNTGLPVMRRLDINYPQYNEASRNDQYLLGDYLMVAPIVEGETILSMPKSKLSCIKDDGTSVPGLKGDYYNTVTPKGEPIGTPVKTVYGDNPQVDWGYGGPEGVGTDKFAVEWSGQYKVGDRDTALHFKGDDGIKVKINGEFVIDAWTVYDVLKSTKYYPANSVLDIEIIYCEREGAAHFSIQESYKPDDGSSYSSTRSVFIPEGNWIDIFNGKRYLGPQEIKVTHGLATSPIFVREGAIIPLANNGTNTQSIKWDEMALDLYPSATYDASQNIYEDDDVTVAYKDGHYRNTNIIMSKVDTANDSVKVNIGEAIGKYSSDFSSRKWTLRMHKTDDVGELSNVKVNGVSVSFKAYAKTYGADPLANNGAAADGNVYEITFNSDIDEASEVVFVFADTSASSARLSTGYDMTEQAFELSVNASNTVDVTSGYSQYSVFGMNGVERINSANYSSIGEIKSYKPLKMQGFQNTDVKYAVNGSVKASRGSLDSYKDMSFTLKTEVGERYYSINVGGMDCLAKMTVRDNSGKNVVTEVFGNHNGFFSRCVVIKVNSEVPTELSVNYSVLSTRPNGTGSYSAITLSAITVSEAAPTISNNVYASVTATIASQVDVVRGSSINLSTFTHNIPVIYSVRDWLKVGSFPGGGADYDYVRKAGGSHISNPVMSSIERFYDYHGGFTWIDGDKVPSQTAKIDDGLCTGGRINLLIKVDKGVNRLMLWTGAWKSDNLVTVYGMDGNIIAKSTKFHAKDESVAKRISFDITAAEESYVQVTIVGGGTNVSLSAVSLLKKA